MIAFLPVYVFLGLNVPIGAYNDPCGYNYAIYRAMLDSAVICGLGYFKPGWLYTQNENNN